jgi:predicted ABC-class ATPase
MRQSNLFAFVGKSSKPKDDKQPTSAKEPVKEAVPVESPAKDATPVKANPPKD